MKLLKPSLALAASLVLASPPLVARQAEDAPKQPPARAELEAQFASRMQGAKLVGFFTDESAGAGKELAEDTYVFNKLEKLEGDRWRIEAGMEYGGRTFAFPIVVEILWAGDTPVLAITDLAIPMVGTFTARVVFHGERYAGIWSGGDHGGQMFGRIVPAGAADGGAAPAPKEKSSGKLESTLPISICTWPDRTSISAGPVPL